MPLVEPVRSPNLLRPVWPRLAIFAALAVLAAGCSSDTGRFNEGLFSNPFSSSSRNNPPPPQSEVTGSVPQRSAHVESRPLPPQGQYQSGPLPPPPQSRASAPQTRPASYASPGVAGGGRGVGSYQPPQSSDVTGSVAAPAYAPPAQPIAQASVRGSGNWDWDGGTAITLAPGETIDTVAHRYGVPSSAIAQANGLAPGQQVQPGQRLVIPKYNYSTAGAANPPAMRGSLPPPPPQHSAPLTTGSVRQPVPVQNVVHTVNPGDTLMSISRKYNKPVGEIARANNVSTQHRLRLGERITIPGYRAAPATAMTPPPVSAPVTQRAAPQRMVAAEPHNTARVVTPAKENPVEEPANAAAEPSGGGSGFRWPARGRVIAGFGPKPTGQQNDGINLAVPEGTPIKAADDGVVAYAGNELKGYGNLVLVRHSNGFVTAYAHASELMVKRGEQVKRGQVIAKSGQTGNVTSPQLHFEIRKGATPVDPMQHLSGAS
jgi:murein DD-endopeptidase MepM/ murein hydrolase activator NlpD